MMLQLAESSTGRQRELSSIFISAERGRGSIMQYKELIIRMLNEITSEKTLKAIYNLVMMYYRR